MATKSTYQIESSHGTASSIYFWKITNLLTGSIKLFPVSAENLEVKVSSTTDYTFIWGRNDLDQFQCNIIDVKFIGSSGTPNYGSASTDLASIIALI